MFPFLDGMPSLRALLALALTGLLPACRTPAGDDTAETSAPPVDSVEVDPLCEDAVPLTWETFGHGFLIEACNGCHTAGSADRHDAPEEATFDTPAEAWSWSVEILDNATGTDPAMPPQGGVTEDVRTQLYWWLGCGTSGS